MGSHDVAVPDALCLHRLPAPPSPPAYTPPHPADYRVPVVLREEGVLRYAPALAGAVDGRCELAAGGQEEVEIRAATVEAVERLSQRLAAQGRHGEAAALNSVVCDWALWEQGERNVASHRPHHRTLTVYY